MENFVPTSFPELNSAPPLETEPRQTPSTSQGGLDLRVPETKRFDELEAYRGFASLGVLVYHCYQSSRINIDYVYQNTPWYYFFRNLEAGVSVFFALSGFLIFRSYARSIVNREPVQSGRGFLVSRTIRIIPLYYMAILLVWTLRFYGNPDQWLDLLEHLTFTQVFDSRFIFYTIGPAWSLSVEVIFYGFVALLGPGLYYLLTGGKSRGFRAMLLGISICLMVVGSIGYKFWAHYSAQIPYDNHPVYFGPVSKLDNFALGMLLAVLLAYREGFRNELANLDRWLLRLAGLGLFTAAFALRENSEVINLCFHTICAGAFTLILSSTVLGSGGGGWQRFLSTPLHGNFTSLDFTVLWEP